jgi:Zn-dependent peptidase ImmA (M78 family)
MFAILQQATGLSAGQIAGLLGLNPSLVSDWAANRKPPPSWLIPRLASLAGLSPEKLFVRGSHLRGHRPADVVPAIWFKLRDELGDQDREWVLLVRQLGYLIDELEEVTDNRTSSWEALFDAIRRDVDIQAPPREQGRSAAKSFRSNRTLNQGATGVGDVIRGHLRAIGVLVVETPLKGSNLEGCSFYVGAANKLRPCVFANSFQSTWFRRNKVLLHELAHAIFDAPRSAASLDFKTVDGKPAGDVVEERAQAFARAALLPPEVLIHQAQRLAVQWDRLSSENLAALVADTHAEQGLVLSVAEESGLITAEQEARYSELEIGNLLKRRSSHALSTREWAKQAGELSQKLSGRRRTTIPSRSLNLPVPYIKAVLDACSSDTISDSRAAELLMIDETDFAERFRRRGELLAT